MTKFDPTGHFAPHGMMAAPETRRLFSVLARRGGTARFVGGCVRDALLARELVDVDIACDLKPEATMAALKDAGIRVIPTGLQHGTITALINDYSYEVTTLRVDVTTDGRHADVAFTDNWLLDAKRRDFTFNALYADIDGTLYDPFHGEADLRIGKVRFIGVAEDRIAEDYLRILRFFRFFAHYGRPPIDPVGAEACRKGVMGLRDISSERIRDEMFKLLRAKSPAATIGDMIGFSVLPPILPELTNVARLRIVEWLETTALQDAAISIDPLRRMAALFMTDKSGDDAIAHAAQFARSLRLSNDEIERFSLMCVSHHLIDNEMDGQRIRRHLYHMGVSAFRDAVIMAWGTHATRSGRPKPGENRRWQDMLEMANGWQQPEFPVKGRDILQAKLVPAGPEMGRLLRRAEQYWLEHDMQPDHDMLMDYLAAYVADPSQEIK
ncbi:CCA tRNA nucleotidyltransferase [Thalassospira sp. TSL5-1]|uniref:CCA tRNA nucleotidyltransferase n=1 Tax=Thalassospira sp. TSL5-1 TaxID=1544451 RepID=UPI00093A218F|nr:CCA tRNA nucleotidyltransferase [Thalassospira sp. TSL5-1]OKH88749.1 tRNA nucleotidyltransferase [Thalassospira sp. TSL5-1]